MESLSLEQVSYLAEIIGVAAVIGSIIYLAIQVKQSTQAMRSETSNVVTTNAMGQYHLFASDGELLDIVQRGSHDPDSLTAVERGRFYSMLFGTMVSWQNLYYQWKNNVMDSEAWKPWENLIIDMMSLPGSESVWEARKRYFQISYRRYIEELMTKPANPEYKFLGVGPSN